MSGSKLSNGGGSDGDTSTQKTWKSYAGGKLQGMKSKFTKDIEVTRNVSCDLLPIFMEECGNYMNERSKYKDLIGSCRKMRAKGHKSTMPIPDLDMLLVPFKKCMEKARMSPEINSCWRTYGRHIKAFPDAA